MGNLESGDAFTWTHASLNGGATQYAVVVGVATMQVDCVVLSRSDVGADTDVSAGTFNTNSYPFVGVRGPRLNDDGRGAYRVSFLIPTVDYTLNETTLSSGNKFYTITLEDDWETALNLDTETRHGGAPEPYNFPTDCVVFYRVSTSPSSNKSRHDEALKRVLTAAGMTCDSTTFAAAGTAITGTVSFTIPPLDDTSYQPYFDTVQKLLESSMGYCVVGDDGEVEYTIVAAPSSSEEFTSNLVLTEPPTIAVDYHDVVTEVTVTNSHVPINGYGFEHTSTLSSNFVRRLHGVSKSLVLESVFDVAATRIAAILNSRSLRRATYTWRLATKLLDATIGEDVQLTHSRLLGGAASDDVKLTSLRKSADSVEVEATDLEGL